MTEREILAAREALQFIRGCEEGCGLEYTGCWCRESAVAALGAAERTRALGEEKDQSRCTCQKAGVTPCIQFPDCRRTLGEKDQRPMTERDIGDDEFPEGPHDVIRGAVLDAAQAIRSKDDVRSAHAILYQGAKEAAKLLASALGEGAGEKEK
jgi:hypothetical protein